MKKQLIWMMGIALAVIIAGCEKNSFNEFEDLSDAVTIAEDEVFALKSAEATDCDVNAARFGGHLFQGKMKISGPHLFFGENFPDCATVSVESLEEGKEFPKIITIDYGEGCTGRAGLEKRGIITLHMTDTILNPGAEYTITFDGMTIGNREVDKTALIKNITPEGAESPVISYEYEMISTVVSEGSTMEMVRNFSESKVWVSGFTTPEIEDDIFYLSGGGSLTVNGETRFDRQIVEDLLIDRTCMFPLEGVIEISKGEETMTIDYGDGECDNLATVTKGDEVEEIELVSGKFKKSFKRQSKNMKQKKGWW